MTTVRTVAAGADGATSVAGPIAAPRTARRIAFAALLGFAAAACSPALDWRTARPDASVELLFPCRPVHDARRIRLGETIVAMRMDSCHAAGATFSLAIADAADAGATGTLLLALRAAAIGNIGGVPTELPWALPGAPAATGHQRLRIAGRLTNGRAVVEDTAFFVRGSHVYQASVLGESAPLDAADTFFTSIKAAR